MNRRIGSAHTGLVTLALGAMTASGCEQVKRVGGSDGGNGACVPPEVQAAFDRSCSMSGCHDANGTGQSLSLTPGNSADIIGKTAVQKPIPLVTLGDTGNSYLAHKMVDSPPSPILGTRMPVGFMASNTAQAEDVTTILAWIAGSPFACDGGGSTGGTDGSGSASTTATTATTATSAGTSDSGGSSSTGDAIQMCGLADLKPGASNPIVSGTGAGQIPTDIGAILLDNCGCHLVDALDVPVADYTGPFAMATLAGWQAMNTEMTPRPYSEVAIDYLGGDNPFMPLGSACNVGDGLSMPEAERATLLQWVTEGVPDGATWMP